ncbi:MAG: hypothetical protein AABY81_04360 [Pseudomonadota bacterium]
MTSKQTISTAAKVSTIETEPALVIVDAPYDVEETEQPFGKRWGGEIMTLTKEHLTALQEGKLVAVDVMNEYVVFLRLQVNDEGKSEGLGHGG